MAGCKAGKEPIGMCDGVKRAARRRTGRAAGGVSGVLALGLLLGACSQVPDWANPGEWVLESEPEEPTRVSAEPEGGAGGDAEGEEEFPNLASVPEAPKRPSTKQERESIAEGLAADRGGAQYSDEELRAEEPEEQSSAAVSEAMESGEVPSPPAVDEEPEMPEQPAGQAETAETQAASTGEAEAASAPEPEPAPEREAATSQQAASQQAASQQAAPQPSGTRDGGEGPRMLQSEQGEPVRVVPGAAPPPEPAMPQDERQAQTPEQPAVRASGGQTQTARAPANGGAAAPGRQIAVIYFSHGSAGLDSRDRSVLREVAKIQRDRGATLRVVGHSSSRTESTDIAKHRMINFGMSLERAETVADALESMNVPGDRIVVQARADSEPVFHEFMPTGEAGNRRVEIYLQ